MSHATVKVEGRARAEVDPDVMVVSLEVDVGSETAQAARDREQDHRQTLLLALDEYIDAEAATVTAIQVGETEQMFDADIDEPYTAQATLEIRCSPCNLDDVVHTAVDNGAAIEYVEPRINEARRESIRTDLLERATANARKQAETIAHAADQRIARVQSLSTIKDCSFGGIADDILGAMVSADYNPGPIELAATVEATFDLEPAQPDRRN